VKIAYAAGHPWDASSDALIVPIASSDQGPDPGDGVRAALGGLWEGIAGLAADARLTGKRATTLLVPTLDATAAKRIVLTGIGNPADLSEETVRRAWGVAATAARDAGAKRVSSLLPATTGALSADKVAAAAVEGAKLATYRFTRHFGTAREADKSPKTIESFTVYGGEHDEGAVKEGLVRGERVAEAVSLARDLSAEPGNALYPVRFAEIAAQVAEEQGLEITVLGPAQMEARGMGAITAVGRGSANEPRLIHLVYRPAAEMPGMRTLGFVGKAITFDTGGYSIKPSDSMIDMKGDMTGGAAVLGAMSALRAVNCPHVVHAVICSAENMISANAFRPDDVLTAMNGVTIEVLSTDAEGRLVLADGLVYTKRQGVEEMIDLATLTGAKIVALGDETVALYSNRDDLAQRLLAAAARSGELMWRMPLTAELEDQIKGEIADIKNSGGRAGGSITAALFLQHFSEGLPWAHLDIAGSDRTKKARPYTPRGATGVGVRTLLAYATE
jgi:leucyl aminopeptidase